MLYPEVTFITNKCLKRTECKVANVISIFSNLINELPDDMQFY